MADGKAAVRRYLTVGSPAAVRCPPDSERAPGRPSCRRCPPPTFLLLRTRQPAAKPERALLGIGGVPYERMFAAESRGRHNAVRRTHEGCWTPRIQRNCRLLPTAQGEVLTAARLLGPTSVALTGDQATETALKAQSSAGSTFSTSPRTRSPIPNIRNAPQSCS